MRLGFCNFTTNSHKYRKNNFVSKEKKQAGPESPVCSMVGMYGENYNSSSQLVTSSILEKSLDTRKTGEKL